MDDSFNGEFEREEIGILWGLSRAPPAREVGRFGGSGGRKICGNFNL
jgi:hypothetical protein